MNIGLFFGSFNPIHTGHLIIASSILELETIDQVWLVISPQNPFKESTSLIDEKHRLTMAELATQNQVNLVPCDFEFDLPKPSYTYDTMVLLNKAYPKLNFTIIIGSDNLDGLSKWKESDKLTSDQKFIIYPRKDYNSQAYANHPNFSFVDSPIIELSATDIRNRLKHDKSIEFRVSENIRTYISEQKLYKNT